MEIYLNIFPFHEQKIANWTEPNASCRILKIEWSKCRNPIAERRRSVEMEKRRYHHGKIDNVGERDALKPPREITFFCVCCFCNIFISSNMKTLCARTTHTKCALRLLLFTLSSRKRYSEEMFTLFIFRLVCAMEPMIWIVVINATVVAVIVDLVSQFSHHHHHRSSSSIFDINVFRDVVM